MKKIKNNKLLLFLDLYLMCLFSSALIYFLLSFSLPMMLKRLIAIMILVMIVLRVHSGFRYYCVLDQEIIQKGIFGITMHRYSWEDFQFVGPLIVVHCLRPKNMIVCSIKQPFCRSDGRVIIPESRKALRIIATEENFNILCPYMKGSVDERRWLYPPGKGFDEAVQKIVLLTVGKRKQKKLLEFDNYLKQVAEAEIRKKTVRMSLSEGSLLIQKGQYEEATQKLYMVIRNDDISQDWRTEAFLALERIANENYVEAQTIVGRVYMGAHIPKHCKTIYTADGKIMRALVRSIKIAEQDLSKASRYLKAAAEQGSANAMLSLAALYCVFQIPGAGMKESVFWLNRASEAGNDYAKILLKDHKAQPEDVYYELKNWTMIL